MTSKNEKKVAHKYESEDIQVLEGLEAVRKRPGMYIGSTSETGLHHLVWEIVDNAVDENLAGRCDNIYITIGEKNIVSVRDNGAGFPVSIHPKTGRPAVETALTVLHAGGKFGGGGYKVSGGLHGVGASVVNALSSWLRVEVHRDGKVYEQEYRRGEPLYDLRVIGKTNRTGTTVSFKADDEIFTQTTEYRYKTIYDRMEQTAYLCPGLTISILDERDAEPKESVLSFDGGLKDYVKKLNTGKEVIHDEVVYFSGEKDDITVEVAYQYQDNYIRNSIYSYVNNVNTHEGGTHENGFKNGMKKAVIEYMDSRDLLKKIKVKGKEKPEIDDMLNGLTCVISVKVPEPEFEGQTKTKLGNSEVRPIVDKITYETMVRFLEENPNIATPIIEKIVDAFEMRMALKAKKEEIQRTNKEDKKFSGRPKKLVPCHSTDNTKTELYIVEGDSAGGSAKNGRDYNFQAIMPLRGKIINILKHKLEKILGNEEVRSIRAAAGTGFGEDFDYEKNNYAKHVIMTDADHDGSHIRILLLTLYYLYMRPLIERGHVYIANPPLYKIQKGKQIQYAYSDTELNEVLQKMGKTGVNIQRYKGLGEMNPEQLWDTTMNPETRILTRVTIEDAEKAMEIVEITMGEKVEPRKEFIQKNAKMARIDV